MEKGEASSSKPPRLTGGQRKALERKYQREQKELEADTDGEHEPEPEPESKKRKRSKSERNQIKREKKAAAVAEALRPKFPISGLPNEAASWRADDVRFDSFVPDALVYSRVNIYRSADKRRRYLERALPVLAYFLPDYATFVDMVRRPAAYQELTSERCMPGRCIDQLINNGPRPARIASAEKGRKDDKVRLECGQHIERHKGEIIDHYLSGRSFASVVENNDSDWSHLCGTSDCIAPGHGMWEPGTHNNSRRTHHASFKCDCSKIGIRDCLIGARKDAADTSENGLIAHLWANRFTAGANHARAKFEIKSLLKYVDHGL